MADTTINELLAAIRSLPPDVRLQLIERASKEAAEDTPMPAPVDESPERALTGHAPFRNLIGCYEHLGWQLPEDFDDPLPEIEALFETGQ